MLPVVHKCIHIVILCKYVIVLWYRICFNNISTYKKILNWYRQTCLLSLSLREKNIILSIFKYPFIQWITINWNCPFNLHVDKYYSLYSVTRMMLESFVTPNTNLLHGRMNKSKNYSRPPSTTTTTKYERWNLEPSAILSKNPSMLCLL